MKTQLMAPRVTGLLLLSVFLAGAQDDPLRDREDRQAEREEWFYSQRLYPRTSFPPGARRNAVLQIDRMDAAARARRQVLRREAQNNLPFALTTDASNWTLIGPKPTDPGPQTATSGRVTAIAIDPRDTNVVYMGGAEGGVWKSIDGGVTWVPLTDDQVTLAIGSLALDPQNPDIIYAGTGEGNFNGDGYYGAGILKSTDAGKTWSNILGPFTLDYIGAIAVSPNNGQLVLCASKNGGIWRSDDGGNTWKVTLPGTTGTSVAFDPSNGDSVWAALGAFRGNALNGVYHSTDGGQTWQRVTGSGSASLPTANVGRIELAIAPSAPATMYVQISNSVATGTSTSALMGVYKTTDAGATWTRTSAALLSTWGSQTWYYNTIRVSPTDPNVVWSGGISILRTLNGGLSWTAPSLTGPNSVNMHVDFHALAFTPDGSKLFIGNDGGMYSTTDVTGAQPNWTNLNQTLAITQFYPGMAMDPGTTGVSLAGAQDNGPQLFDGSGKWSRLVGCDGGFMVLDPSFPSLGYTTCQNIDILRSLGVGSGVLPVASDFGIDQTDATQFISPLVIDPSNPQTLYFGTFRVWQTLDGGGQWTAVSPDLTGSKGAGRSSLKAIAVAPSDTNTVYAGTANGRVSVTSDAQKGANSTWTDRSAGLPNLVITSIAVDPVNAATAYVTLSGFPAASRGNIYRTVNGGATWVNISGDLPPIPVNDLLVDPDLPNTLYIATDAGVMITTDGGNSWSSLGNGLPKAAVLALAWSRQARVLRAGTHGRSAWEIAVPLNVRSLRPVIDTLAPATVDAASSGFVLSVAGNNFVPGTVIRWNGQDRKTTFVDAGHVTVQITADDVAVVGRAAVLAFNASTGAGPSTPKNFNIGAGPKTVTAGFVNAAYPAAGNIVAPRSIASLYGTNLASSVVVSGAPPLPFMLAGTTVSNNSNAMPLFFVSPGQINVQVPSNGFPITVPLTVTQGTQSFTVQVKVQQYAPGLFSTNGQGTGQAATVIANTATLVAPAGTTPESRPARPGEFLSIYCTGLGVTNNQPALGSATQSSPLASTAVTPVVTIGGVNAKVIFSGLAPGFVGLNQVNVQVPDGVPPGDAIPVVLTIGGVTSNIVTIAVAAAQ